MQRITISGVHDPFLTEPNRRFGSCGSRNSFGGSDRFLFQKIFRRVRFGSVPEIFLTVRFWLYVRRDIKYRDIKYRDIKYCDIIYRYQRLRYRPRDIMTYNPTLTLFWKL